MGAILARALFATLDDDGGSSKPQTDAAAAWNHLLSLIQPPEPSAADQSSFIEGVQS